MRKPHGLPTTAAGRPAAAAVEWRGVERAGQSFVCPTVACGGCALTPFEDSGTLVCHACGRSYPLIEGQLPVLTPEPERHLACEAIRLGGELDWLRDQAARLSAGGRRFPRRAADQERIREALASAANLLEQILDGLLACVGRRALVEAAARPTAMDTTAYRARRLGTLLRRDFGGEPESELEVRTLTEAVKAELRRDGARPERILVLGCGVGRLAEELAAAGSGVCAIDLSAVLLTAAVRMRMRPLQACDLQTRNARHAAGQAHLFTARHTTTPGTRGPVEYAVADATAMPFRDASWPTVVSVYFTDVVPLSRLLPEVRRVMEPGGRFIHVGPLGYHFNDPAEHLSAEALLEEMQVSGFAVSPARWVTSTHLRAREALYGGWFENLVFSATRTLSDPAANPPLPPFAVPGTRVSSRVRCRP